MSAVRRVSSVSAAVASVVGGVRKENQDRVAIARARDALGHSFTVVALADGIGGMQDGALCAALTLGSFLASIIDESRRNTSSYLWLSEGVACANAAVHAKYRGTGGSTLVAALIAGDGSVQWTSVGDSRVYHATSTKLNLVSTDDTIAGQLGRNAGSDFNQSKLLQFIGVGNPIEPTVGKLDSSSGQLLLTSDGVHFLDSTPWFGMIVQNAPDPGVCVRRLMDVSQACGGPDNASAAALIIAPEPDSSSAGSLLPTGGLEVWDPFGDLQIVLAAPDFVATSEWVSPPSAVSDTGAGPAAARGEPASPAADLHGRKKGRGSKKSKPRGRDLGDNEERAAEKTNAPQLVMEFPNKPN